MALILLAKKQMKRKGKTPRAGEIMKYKRRILTPIQQTVLRNLAREKRAKVPRSSLERLQKKGLVSGNRKEGWVLTRDGEAWLALDDPPKKVKSA